MVDFLELEFHNNYKKREGNSFPWETTAEVGLIRDEVSVRKRLTEELGLGEPEAETYILALKQGRVADAGGPAVESLLRRGMLIKATDEKGYLPVHPRLALSNLFRSFGDRATPAMREKRRMVDRLTAELIAAYESRRGLR
jgi:hypothetical protein